MGLLVIILLFVGPAIPAFSATNRMPPLLIAMIYTLAIIVGCAIFVGPESLLGTIPSSVVLFPYSFLVAWLAQKYITPRAI